MKNIIRKISAVALAFTLLGTGTAIAKNVNPKSVITLSAHAACNHVPMSSPRPIGGLKKLSETTSNGMYKYVRYECQGAWVCTKCGERISYCKIIMIDVYEIKDGHCSYLRTERLYYV